MNADLTVSVGVGREIISPPLGTPLIGYPVIRETESIHDDLQVTAIAFKYGEKISLLISATVIFLLTEDSIAIREAVSKETGVDFSNIILCCTHTHSSPATYTEIKNDDYIYNLLLPQTVSAAKGAIENAQPAYMGIGTIESHAGVNRREVDRTGGIWLGQNPWGCFDPTMTVVSFRTVDKKPIVNLIHYGAHCTAAGRSVEVTRDWAGVMVDRLEQQSGAVTVFVNGAIGDTGPRLSDGSTAANLELALELGAAAALDATTAYRSIKEYRPVDMKVSLSEVKLPYLPQMSYEEAKAEYATYSEEQKKEYYGRCYHLREVMAEYESKRPLQEHLSIHETIISVGPLAFVPFPFEMFTEMTLQLRKFSPYQHTLSLCNGNGYYGYLPSQDQICRGGYEVAMFRDFNPYMLKDDTDTTLVVQLADVLEKMYKE